MLLQAPGRVNLIGEHTDYSDGFVLPVAINLGITMAMRPREDSKVRVYSIDFDETMEIDLSDYQNTNDSWQEYIKSLAWALQEDGYELRGWDGVMAGNIPIGAGLSSSAALENIAAKAFALASDFTLSLAKMAILSQKGENQWVGVNVGIMDQLISAAGQQGHAMLIDCRTLEYEHIPIPDHVTFMVLDTMTRRELTNSNYNLRRQEVEQACEVMQIDLLRDCSQAMLCAFQEQLEPLIFKRAHHVVTENDRVLRFGEAMRTADLQKMGELLNQSHASLRDDYEVSSKELNTIVEISQAHPACLGARMTGAGFAGCALALIDAAQVDSFKQYVYDNYHAKTGIEPNIFPVDSANGVQVL